MPKTLSFILVMAGILCLLFAAQLLGGVEQSSGLSCKAICGLALLAKSIFGEVAGNIVGAVLWGTVGMGLLVLVWRYWQRS